MTLQSRTFVRPAEVTDAETLAKLINVAGEGIPEWLWRRAATDQQSPLEIGAARARRESGGFSYANAMVAEQSGQVAGMVLSYAITEAPTDDPNDLPAPIAPFVALEKLSIGTWYINALAVRPSEQNKGFGKRLLAAAEAEAKANGYSEMSIQVYGENAGAVRLYGRLGYGCVASAPVRLHPSPPYYTGDVLLLKKTLAG